MKNKYFLYFIKKKKLLEKYKENEEYLLNINNNSILNKNWYLFLYFNNIFQFFQKLSFNNLIYLPNRLNKYLNLLFWHKYFWLK